jgi:hypothetical protein
MPKSIRRFRPTFDSLENRLTPANFSASVISGSLIIHGDDGDSSVVLIQTAPSTFVVSAADGATTINGTAQSRVFTGVTRDVHFGMGGGTDSVQIGLGSDRQ